MCVLLKTLEIVWSHRVKKYDLGITSDDASTFKRQHQIHWNKKFLRTIKFLEIRNFLKKIKFAKMRRFSEKIRFGDLGHFSGKSNIMAFGMQCYKCDKEPGSPASVSSCPTIQFQKLCLSEKLRRTLGGYDFARSF